MSGESTIKDITKRLHLLEGVHVAMIERLVYKLIILGIGFKKWVNFAYKW